MGISNGACVRRYICGGSTDFESVADYQAFIETLISRLNAKCAEAFSQEQAHLQPLPTYRYADYEALTVRVSCHSTISVRCILYSVPSRLVGRQLTVHLYHDRLVGYVGSQEVVELPRLRVSTSAPSRQQFSIWQFSRYLAEFRVLAPLA